MLHCCPFISEAKKTTRCWTLAHALPAEHGRLAQPSHQLWRRTLRTELARATSHTGMSSKAAAYLKEAKCEVKDGIIALWVCC